LSKAPGRVADLKTCKLRIMLQLNFKEASEIIRTVDAELATLLNAVWCQAAKARQRDLCFFLAKYPYKQFVFKNGRAFDPDGQPLRADLLVANQLPVGLILDNLLEVIDEVIREEEVIEFPQSLLFKKHLIGLWELIDQQLKVVRQRGIASGEAAPVATTSPLEI